MSSLDRQTYEIFKNIRDNGSKQPLEYVNSVYEDTGEPSPTVFGDPTVMFFGPNDVPFIESKKGAKKDPIREMRWIYQDKSNNVNLLNEKYNCKVWDQWKETENTEWLGTIGPAYGHVVGIKCRKYPISKLHYNKLNPDTIEDVLKTEFIENGVNYVLLDQLDYLIQELINNPFSRYHIISLWDIHNLDKMKLKPCVWTLNAKVGINGNLNLILKIRSNDMALGNPYNMYQYYVFKSWLAKTVGLKAGYMYATIDDPHYYDRHIAITEEQFKMYDPTKEDPSLDPTFELATDNTNFYKFTEDDCILTVNEREVNGEIWTPKKISFPLSIS